ncbi:hypothetical protein LQV05_006504 [Cryptococcus neoformans]|nr:hypothetical protein J007_01957 [Cryptococcus neoformans var. grubii]OXC62606.1 hypothetical protein C358_02001 [Cryptococcus neoformans var. grubii MW-RSA852]UOH83767.1 hypothetical protein LQV05_006504 [Cryptococcus neoformans]
MPFNDELDTPAFRAWLSRTIEPLCDADPTVLSDYIVALMKHDASMTEDEWKAFISRELVDFLESSSRPFVETLFQTLHSKDYDLTQTLPAPAVSHPIPTGPAAGVAPQPSAGPSTMQNGQQRDVTMQEMPVGVSGRRKCRDYHERGYCMRGANCQYEHSADMLIPTPEMMFQGFLPPFMPGMPGMPIQYPGMQPVRPMTMQGPGFRDGPNGRNRSFGNRPPPSNEGENFEGSSRPPSDHSKTTLLITDIPEANMSVVAIRNYFQQFGTITSVALEGRGNRALVTFASNLEAYKAWKSDEAVFGNRHVKVLWHKPRPGQGAAGQKALEQSKKLLENLQKMEAGEGPNQGVKPKLSGPETRLQATLAELEHREKQSKKEPLIAEQKVLLKRASTGTKEEKVQILKRLREITKELEIINNPPPKPESMDVDDAKSRLDRELAAHGMEMGGQDEEELARLNAQLASLKEKANTLGVNASARYSPYSRGRGGRGRGRGGPPRPMRLDNRSRTILVSGDRFGDEEARRVVQEWYESTGGGVEFVDGSLRITYPQREMAEKALALGTNELREKAGPIRTAWEPLKPVERYQPPDVEMTVHMGEEELRGEKDDDE